MTRMMMMGVRAWVRPVESTVDADGDGAGDVNTVVADAVVRVVALTG